MANTDNPNGFLPYNNPSGGGGQPYVEYFDLASANSAIGVGDPVKWASGVIDRAATGDALCGVAAEAKAASAGGKIAVWCDPQQRFVAQTDDTTGTITALAGIGVNADIVAGAPSNGRSIAEIDESTGDTTATRQLKILRLSEEMNGRQANAYGQFNRMVVKINNHQFGSHTGTAGT